MKNILFGLLAYALMRSPGQENETAGGAGDQPTDSLSLGFGGTVVSTDTTTPAGPAYNPATDPGLVQITVKYPADYKGTRHLDEKVPHFVSRETAELLASKKIAKIVERNPEQIAKGALTPAAPKPAPPTAARTANDEKLDAEKVTGTNAVTSDATGKTVAADAAKKKP